MYSGSSHIQNIFPVFTYFEEIALFPKETFVAIPRDVLYSIHRVQMIILQQIKIFQNPEMKIFAFFASFAVGHPIGSTYEKTCTATCTGVTKNWTSYKSSDGYGVTTTGKQFAIKSCCSTILCFQLI